MVKPLQMCIQSNFKKFLEFLITSRDVEANLEISAILNVRALKTIQDIVLNGKHAVMSL